MSVYSNTPQPTGLKEWPIRVARLWQRMTQPHPSVSKSGRQRARMLSGLLLALSLIGFFAFAITFFSGEESFAIRVVLSSVAGLLIIYWLSRSRFYRWASIATIAVISIPVIAATLDGGQIYTLSFLVLCIFVGSLFFSVRLMFLFTLLTMGTVFCVLPFVPPKGPQVISTIIFLFASTGYLAILIASAGRRDLAQIEKQTRKLTDEVEEHKQTENALQEKQERLAEAQRIAHLGSFEWDIPTNTVTWSDELYRIYGLEPQSFGATFEAFLAQIHEDDRERVQNDILSAYQQGTSFGLEERIVRPDGTLRTLRTQGEVIKDANGTPVKLRGVCTDITEQKRGEAERSQLYVAERSARQIAETLQAANLALTLSLDLETVLETFLDCLEQLVPYDTANVMLLQDDDTLAVHAQRGYEAFTDRAKVQALSFDVRQNQPLRPLVEEQRSVLIPDTREFVGWERAKGAEHVISWLGVPLVVGGKMIGIYSLDKAEAHFFTAEHQQLAEALTAQAATAIQNALLVEEGKRYAAELEQRIVEAQEAEQNLQAERDFAQLVMNTMGQGLVVTDNEITYQYVNPAFAQLVGLTPDEVIGLHPQDFIVPEDQTTLAEQIAVRRAGTSGSYEIQLKHAEGHSVPVIVTSVSFKNKRNGVNAVAVVTDLTERKQAENALRREQEMLQAVLESLNEGVVACDQDGQLTIFNRTARQWHGMDALSLPSEQWADHYDLYAEDGKTLLPTESIPLLRAFQGESVRDAPMTIAAKGHTPRQILASGNAFFNAEGQKVGAVVAMHDITERKRAEAERIARQSAEAANVAKSEFLSRMSHELRTPMNSILGFAQLMEMSQKEPLTTTQHARVEQILKAGQHLLELINEVLEISRIEAGRLDISLEAVAVAQVVSEVLDLTVPLADERQIRVRREIDPEQETYVKADQQRFKQVMINLLANAIKYNSEGGEVRLTCESRPDGWQRISIHDTGPGIALADQARLFQPFERLGGAQQAEVTGTGLGLALSKRLVELMGGQIGVESAIGKGSTFWIELPAATPQLNGEVSQSDDRPRPEIRGEGHTILYIEDNLTNFDLVEQVLAEESQVSLHWAIQGSVGLDLARQHLPDLILLDLHLPDMHGSEVLAQLRQDEATAAIPVIVISADATPHQIERLMAGGAEAYLTKPLNVPEFLHTIERLLTGN